jgi:hypothetical protein
MDSTVKPNTARKSKNEFSALKRERKRAAHFIEHSTYVHSSGIRVFRISVGLFPGKI